MPTPTGATPESRGVCARKTGRVVLAGALTVSLTGSVALISAPAMADPKPPVIPSQNQVDAARKAVGDKAAQVKAVEARLAAGAARLEALGRASDRAAEAYNGAVYRLKLAKAEAAASEQRARKAQADLDAQGRQIGRFAAASYQSGGGLARIAPLFTADGTQSLLDRAGTAQSVSGAMQASYLRYSASRVVTNAFKLQAEQALAEVRKATAAAAAAKARAEAAVKVQQAAVAGAAVERRQLIGQLATLRKVSYQVAAQRQQGLEELARQRAAAEAARRAAELRRRAAEKAAAEAAARAAEAARKAAQRAERAKAERAREAAERAERAAREAREARDQKAREEAARRAEDAARDAERQTGSGSSEGTRSGAERAVAFARAQLGEPYVWGADGPDSWDCSGLTMGAWERGGVDLPHYSAAQYEQIEHISADDLRPGDLIFWADDPDDPATIFHVALYIGDGYMIHAPRPGASVRIDSVYYWVDPDFFGRP
ncbi:MAG TPA: C40 family peptidase [Kribbellaceae bacterium]